MNKNNTSQAGNTELFLLNYLIGMYGLVLAQVLADILTVIVSFYVFFRYRRQLREEEMQAA